MESGCLKGDLQVQALQFSQPTITCQLSTVPPELSCLNSVLEQMMQDRLNPIVLCVTVTGGSHLVDVMP